MELPPDNLSLDEIGKALEERTRVLDLAEEIISSRVNSYEAMLADQIRLINKLLLLIKKARKENNQGLEDRLIQYLREVAQGGEGGSKPTRNKNALTWIELQISGLLDQVDYEAHQTTIVKLLGESTYWKKAAAETPPDSDDRVRLEKILQFTIGWLLNKTKSVQVIKGKKSESEEEETIQIKMGMRDERHYPTHCLELIATSKERISLATTITALLHDLIEKGGEFIFDPDKLAFELRGISLDHFEKRMGAFGELIGLNVQMLTEMELKDHFGGRIGDDELKDKKISIVREIQKNISQLGKNLLSLFAEQHSDEIEKRTNYIFEKIVNFGNLAMGVRRSVEEAMKIHDEYADNQLIQEVIMRVVIEPRIRVEILDRLNSDVATITNRVDEKIKSGKWKKVDVIAYFERYYYFIEQLTQAINATGLNLEYQNMLENALENVEYARRTVESQSGIIITEQEIAEWRRLREIMHQELVTPYVEQKVEDDTKKIKSIIEKLLS